MSFKKRKYGSYDGFELPKNISENALKRLQAAIGAGIFTKVTNDQPDQSSTVSSQDPPAEPTNGEDTSQA